MKKYSKIIAFVLSGVLLSSLLAGCADVDSLNSNETESVAADDNKITEEINDKTTEDSEEIADEQSEPGDLTEADDQEETDSDEDDLNVSEEDAIEDSEDVEFLPGYKTFEEWSNRHTGSASYIDMPTVIISIFVDEEEDVWTPEEKQYALNICKIGYEYIADTLKNEYGAETNLIYDWSKDPELVYSTRIYETISAYVETEEERHIDELELQWANSVPYKELMEKYNTDSVAFLYFIPHEGCSYSSSHFIDDKDFIWNEGCLLYLQDMYSPTYDYETPTVYAHELLHLFGAEDYYASADVFSKETYNMLSKNCADDIMLHTFDKINGVYTTYPDKVKGEITPITAYLIGVGDEEAVKEIPELIKEERACFSGSTFDRPF